MPTVFIACHRSDGVLGRATFNTSQPYVEPVAAASREGIDGELAPLLNLGHTRDEFEIFEVACGGPVPTADEMIAAGVRHDFADPYREHAHVPGMG